METSSRQEGSDRVTPFCHISVICTEMLVQRLQQAESKGELTRLSVARGAPSVSHLLYADDSMFYGKHSDEELNRIT